MNLPEKLYTFLMTSIIILAIFVYPKDNKGCLKVNNDTFFIQNYSIENNLIIFEYDHIRMTASNYLLIEVSQIHTNHQCEEYYDNYKFYAIPSTN